MCTKINDYYKYRSFTIKNMIFLQKTIIYYCCHLILTAKSQPIFCSQTQYDAVFNFGPILTVRKGDWVWTYDHRYKRMAEPIKQSPYSLPDYWQIKTSFWISDIPLCEQNTVECDNYVKAQYLVPVFLYDTKERYEHWTNLRIHANTSELRADKPGYPWNIDQSLFSVWPQDWIEDKLNDRAAVYWPNRFQVMYITGNGNRNKSAISYNTIRADKWWTSLQRQPIHSNVQFVGMFNSNGNLYAFGDNRHNGNNGTKLYNIVVSVNHTFNIFESAISLQKFFGCDNTKQTTLHTTTQTIEVTSDEIDDRFVPENDRRGKDDNKSSVIMIVVAVVVVILVFIIALIALIALIIITKKRSKKQETSDNNIDASNTEMVWKASDTSVDDTTDSNLT